MPESMLAFAYGRADARLGADVLRTMVLAQGSFAMLGIATTVLTSIGRERTAAWVTLGALMAVLVMCFLLVPGARFGHQQLLRSAQATAIAFAAALVVGALIVRSRTGAFVPLKSALRVGIAVAACFALGHALPHLGRLLTPLLALFVAGTYVIVLVATREIGAAERAWVRALVTRRR
jgi:O-antigen/teichoic acid export membrane protein